MATVPGTKQCGLSSIHDWGERTVQNGTLTITTHTIRYIGLTKLKHYTHLSQNFLRKIYENDFMIYYNTLFIRQVVYAWRHTSTVRNPTASIRRCIPLYVWGRLIIITRVPNATPETTECCEPGSQRILTTRLM